MTKIRDGVRYARAIGVTRRTHYLLTNAGFLGIGIVAIVVSLTTLLLPANAARNTISIQLGSWATAYYLAMLVGGSFLVISISFGERALEVLALCILAAALLIYGVAIVATVGTTGLTALPPLLGFSAACIGRTLVLARVVRVREDEGEACPSHKH